MLRNTVPTLYRALSLLTSSARRVASAGFSRNSFCTRCFAVAHRTPVHLEDVAVLRPPDFVAGHHQQQVGLQAASGSSRPGAAAAGSPLPRRRCRSRGRRRPCTPRPARGAGRPAGRRRWLSGTAALAGAVVFPAAPSLPPSPQAVPSPGPRRPACPPVQPRRSGAAGPAVKSTTRARGRWSSGVRTRSSPGAGGRSHHLRGLPLRPGSLPTTPRGARRTPWSPRRSSPP